MNEQLVQKLIDYTQKTEEMLPAALQDYMQYMLLSATYTIAVGILTLVMYAGHVYWIIKKEIDIDNLMILTPLIIGFGLAVVSVFCIIVSSYELIQITYHPQGYLVQKLIQGVRR